MRRAWCQPRMLAQTNYSQFKHDNPRTRAAAVFALSSSRKQLGATDVAGQRFARALHRLSRSNSSQIRRSEICSICHTDAQSGKMKPFPPLRSFNVRFDHAKHARQARCATCHRRNRGGVGLSIPARMNAHVTCFGCHTPGAKASNGRDISSCGTCHQLGRFVRTSEQAAAYRVGFSHASHDASEKLACATCHTDSSRVCRAGGK